MNQHTDPPTESTQPGRLRWQVTVFQLLFGAMAVGLGGFISAEPTLLLDRRDDGRLECRYALNAYGWFPTMTASIDDLVHYEVTQSQQRGSRGTRSSGAGSTTTRYNLRLVGRDGSEFSVGQTWSLTELDRMMEGGRSGPSHQERITAGPARRYGGLALGAFGLLLLAGAIWNIVLMAIGLGSPTAVTHQG
jgi:hypothetical protein